MDKSIRCRLDGKGGKVMVTLLLGTFQNCWNQGALYVYTFFLYFLMICINSKCRLNLPKFAEIHKSCVGFMGIWVYGHR